MKYPITSELVLDESILKATGLTCSMIENDFNSYAGSIGITLIPKDVLQDEERFLNYCQENNINNFCDIHHETDRGVVVRMSCSRKGKKKFNKKRDYFQSRFNHPDWIVQEFYAMFSTD